MHQAYSSLGTQWIYRGQQQNPVFTSPVIQGGGSCTQLVGRTNHTALGTAAWPGKLRAILPLHDVHVNWLSGTPKARLLSLLKHADTLCLSAVTRPNCGKKSAIFAV